nr:immunoglobulin heavy chain junction region [Macaca mulatta]
CTRERGLDGFDYW